MGIGNITFIADDIENYLNRCGIATQKQYSVKTTLLNVISCNFNSRKETFAAEETPKITVKQSGVYFEANIFYNKGNALSSKIRRSAVQKIMEQARFSAKVSFIGPYTQLAHEEGAIRIEAAVSTDRPLLNGRFDITKEENSGARKLAALEWAADIKDYLYYICIINRGLVSKSYK